MSRTVASPAVFAPEALGAGRVVVEDSRIAAVLGPGPADEVWPGPLLPGFVDLQCNGVGEVAFATATPGTWECARDALVATGTTTVLPTYVTGTDYAAAWANLPGPGVPDVPGVHVEGPLLNPARAGAHPSELLGSIPDTALAGPVRLVTLAPEVRDALDAARRLVASGVTVAAGHSDAAYEEALAAFDAGVSVVTHLWNACPPLHHRRPGLVAAALECPHVVACVIPDGVHVDPAVVRLTWRLKGPAATAAVTDAVAPRGTALAAPVTVRDGAPRLSDGTLAGSILTMDTALRNLLAWGIPLPDAAAMCATTPAGAVGLLDRGRLAPGLRADLVGLDEDDMVARVIAHGARVL